MSVVRADAPCRVDLAGGTLDLWPLSVLVDDAVTINAAIDVRTSCEMVPRASGWTFAARDGGGHVELARLPRRPEREVPAGQQLAAVVVAHFDLPPCAVRTWSDAPRGSGLGASSSLAVALIRAAAARAGEELTDPATVELACNLETRILGLPAGTQDHWAACTGGLSVLELGVAGTRRRGLPRSAGGVADALVVADTRVQHHSGMNNWAVYRSWFDGDPGTRAALADVAAAAVALREALLSGQAPAAVFAEALAAVRAEWRARRRLAPEVTCPEVARLVAAAEDAGGAAKVCGAGGGGCVVALPRTPAERPAVEAALTAAGGSVLPARVVDEGVRVTIGA